VEDMQTVKAGSLSETESLCPVCLERIPSSRIREGECVYLAKTCPAHGPFKVALWRGDPPYEAWDRQKEPWHPPHPATTRNRGCPFDCGLCPEHRQQTCTALLEVTQRCTMQCPVCFADSRASSCPDPDLPTIERWYKAVLANGIRCNIQLSGGEPTLRDDLPEIVAMGRSLGFEFIQLNTNGLRLASDLPYVERLRDAGLASVFLQFDGTTDEVYQQLRGRPLVQAKQDAIRHCEHCGIGVVLVPTVVPGVNDRELGHIVHYAIDHMPCVRGVHFQPISYFGRYPKPPSDVDRITIPEIIQRLEIQTHGLVTVHDFSPPGCENAHCSFHGTFVLMPGGVLKSFSSHGQATCCCGTSQAAEGAEKARAFVSRQWAQPKDEPCCGSSGSGSLGYWEVILERARTHTLSISGMAFQDVWNVDLERVKDCCIHVVATDGRLVPFCAYNLTGSSGRPLYPRGPAE
jgi:7,8-dihydro-6-hydroxymethylpterin dimethyltransferase